MSAIDTFLGNLPEVARPTQRRLAFKEKIKWTLLILALFFLLGTIPLYGLGANGLANFEFLSLILGAEFGSIISLGIGPIVTASIVLQLLNGSGIVKFDLTSHTGKARFQGIQKLLAIIFILFEAVIYVIMGGLSPEAGVPAGILIFQLILGGILIMFMDEVVSKWGFGNGISLFIAAGVSKSLFLRAFNWIPPEGQTVPPGKVWSMITFLGQGEISAAAADLAMIVATLLIFAMVVYVQAMKVEIPLSFGRVRGQGVRWPLNFMYTSNIPVILVAALLANFQLMASFLGKWNYPLGNPATGTGLISWFSVPRANQGGLVGEIIAQGTFALGWEIWAKALVYLLFFVGGSVLFGIFWVQTAGLDSRAQAKQMMASGLQIPGFRKDQRVLERLLDRYIMPLTVMGGIAIGILAALADLLGALTSGTGLLLAVMIIYRLYEDIARQHMMDMNPMMRKFMGGGS